MVSIGLDESWSETFAGYAYKLYAPARRAGDYYEKMTRPDHTSLVARVSYLGKALFCSCAAVFSPLIATPVFVVSRLLQKKEIVVKTHPDVSQDIIDEKVKILFINQAFQSGMFPQITANQTSPYDRPFSDQHPSREAANIAFVKDHEANIVCSSEVHDLASMNELEKRLRDEGFTNFIKHLPTHPIFVNSGLFVASKKPILEANFIAYPFKIRSGVHLGAEQGCITFDVKEGKKTIRVASTHLNFGERECHHTSRSQQLKLIFESFSEGQTTILGGDFNYEYMKKNEELKELAKPHTIHSLLREDTKTTRVVFQEGDGVGRKLNGPEEVIDAAILVNGEEQEWKAEVIEPKVEGRYVTDHFGVLVTQNPQKSLDEPIQSNL